MTTPNVALFVTCLVDLFRPVVGFSAVKLLENAGCTVDVPSGQTCCGQPAFNQGARADTAAIAKQTIDALIGYDYIVVPSGSCAGMLNKHYVTLFADDDPWQAKAEELADRTFELITFLTEIRGVRAVDAQVKATATYHDSCSGLRELGIKQQPRDLLKSVDQLRLSEMPNAEVCCGFGGTFCVKYPDISTKMVSDKTRNIEASGADLLLAGDLGCLLNMAGRLKRLGSKVEARHVAEVLAGDVDTPPIGSAPADRA
ncbi:MAG: (Fe-S)-binding protein [Geminicoccaceae bacterium]